MPNIYDYMDWRGDLPISRDGFNEVDNLVLSAFAYVPLDGIVPSTYPSAYPDAYGGGVTIGEAAQAFAANKALLKLLRMRKDKHLFEAIGNCPRFASLRLHAYVNRINQREEKQFAAVSIDLGDGSLFVAYRGTDSTLVGWKEDFNMSFMRQIPAQADAVAYLAQAAASFDGHLRLGGHSKGGNLAVYAAAFCPPCVQDRIIAVYNNDGPWLHGEIAAKPGYQAVRERIHAFIPQSSVIGMLLEHEDDYTVVHSSEKGLFQHDFYSWEIAGNSFVHLAEVTSGSQFVDHTLKSWLESWDEQQRAVFVDALFQVISATGARTFQEMKDSWQRSTLLILKSLITLDKDTRKAVNETLKLLMRAATKHWRDFTPNRATRKEHNECKSQHNPELPAKDPTSQGQPQCGSAAQNTIIGADCSKGNQK